MGHQRLSIIDLSEKGRQPMISEGARYVISYNGEVYNFREMRRELEQDAQAEFQGKSDVEVVLAAIENWGLRRALGRFNGMFAFALWDRKEQVLHLVRDRLGIKPIYYGWSGRTFLFGSEPCALATYPGFNRTIDRDAVALFLRHGYVPAPRSIFMHARKLGPGEVLTVAPGDTHTVEIHSYWSAKAMMAASGDIGFSGSENEAVDRLNELLGEAVRMRMVSDVPLGAFLSGGIDSSTIVALMQEQSNSPVHTFTIGVERRGYDEAEHARQVAEHLGTQHTELYVTEPEILQAIPRLPALYSEPFADSSQVPMWLVSKLARQSVTVALSGDGGDELFAGYNRYIWAPRVWNRLRHLPSPVRAPAARLLSAIPAATWERTFRALNPLLPSSLRLGLPEKKMRKLTSLVGVSTPGELRIALMSHWKQPHEVVLGVESPGAGSPEDGRPEELVSTMMLHDLIDYLPNDILTKVDRASMAVGLEARVPLLDHRVAEFAWRLPLQFKLSNGVGKRTLRTLLSRNVPPRLTDRPKMGFAVPIGEWLRGPLRDWAEALLAPDRIRGDGIFLMKPIRAKWHEHLSGQENWEDDLWDVLMFQAWYENWARRDSVGDVPSDSDIRQSATNSPASYT
jgi:asparagine synthase (glutamine-hydrolysing)